MLTNAEAEARVARGAAHLDQVRPGWFRNIDTGTLTMSGSCLCIIGQLNGAAAGWRVERLGFDPCHPDLKPAITLDAEDTRTYTDPVMERTADYLTIQDAWIQAIADRLHPIQEASVEAPVEVG